MDSPMINFFDDRTIQNVCGLTPGAFWLDHRAMHNWSLTRVTRPGEPAANEPLPEQGSPRQVWITRLGAYTRVILLAGEGANEAAPSVSAQRWA